MQDKSYIRELANSPKYQTLFDCSKELSGIYLFENNNNFTPVQISFLKWLTFYSNLRFYLSMDEVSEHIFDDEIYEDAFIKWKTKNKGTKKDNKPHSSRDVKLIKSSKPPKIKIKKVE